MRYDVIVIGSGHAGCEAAAAAARMCAQVALVTLNVRAIGAMSCNPAIGGVGKGHLVRELDVFDGLMARAADHAGIHYRMLNRSKGAAVRGPRVQADRKRYRYAVSSMIHDQPGLTTVIGSVSALLIEGGRATGVRLTDDSIITGRTVILATGTFLGARLFRGEERWSGGRLGDAAATELARQLRALSLPIARLKTGTPPRLLAASIDWSRIERHPSDPDAWTMSPLTGGRAAPQVACGITRTTAMTHELVRDALALSPLRTGAIGGAGPRYCPSLEDKVVRFADRDSHQIFLEPEGLDDPLIYPNGISTSLDADAQRKIVRSIPGLESAKIVEPGYAVEYDYIDPRCLDRRLQLRALPGLYCAGQINGTTGYEEAAAQGLVAGLSAAAEILDRQAATFERASSYIGVMIDDLTLQGVTEPYRMLTSRAEFRLSLRANNATTRLGEIALASGAVSEDRRRFIADRAETKARLESGSLPASAAEQMQAELLEEIEDDRSYAPYLARQAAEIARMRADEQLGLATIDSYAAVPGLSGEMIERLEAARPETLGAAARIRGITPAALTAILLATRRRAA